METERVTDQLDGPAATLQSVEGVIQRLDHQTRRLAVLAEDRLWRFALAPAGQVWFNNRRAPFRCLQIQDHVRVYCHPATPDSVVEAFCVFAEGTSTDEAG